MCATSDGSEHGGNPARAEPARRLSRKAFIRKSAIAGAVFAAGGTGVPSAGARIRYLNRKLAKRTIIVGLQPGDVCSSAVTRYLQNHPQIFQTEAARLGYEIDVQWRNFPNAQPIMQLYKAGPQNLTFGVIGTTPGTTIIAQNLPVEVIGTSSGKMPFNLLVRPDSTIKSLADLRGKTVGTVVGADPQNAFIQTIQTALGASPSDLGINFVNFPTLPLAASLPSGIDAAGMVPAITSFQALNNNQARILVDTLGRTGTASSLGPGKILPSVSKSPFSPEGFYEHRGLWTCHADILANDPKLVEAFVITMQKGLAGLKNWSRGKAKPVGQLMMSEWGVPLSFATRLVYFDLVWQRGWGWNVEGDFVLIVAGSQALVNAGNLSSPVSWDNVETYMHPAAQIEENAWNTTGHMPPLSVFAANDPKLRELRGYPVWEPKKWGRYFGRKIHA